MNMKQRLMNTLLAACLLASPMLAQHPYDAIKQDIRRAGGVFNQYDFSTPNTAKAPQGYEPFYISHYGRHGSRMSSSNSTYEKMLSMLTKAHKEGKLTKRGEEFYEKYVPMYPLMRMRAGDLTTKGQKEHHLLAHRMYENYPEVFKDGIKAAAISTNSPRAMMSMYAFLEGLRECDPKIETTSTASLADMNPANPFLTNNPEIKSTDAGFKNPNAVWLKQLEDHQDKILRPKDFLKNIFKDESAYHKYGSPTKVEKMFYEVCCSAQTMENQQLLWDIFDMDELCRMWEYDNLKYYLSKGAAGHSNGRQWSFVWVTMQDILDKADTAIKTKQPTLDLRFGHDIVIMSLMTLLDIDGWNKAVSDDSVKYVYKEYEVPMGSNMQFVFYKNKKNDILVRFMLNEKDQYLPISSSIAPYYKWEDFKKYAIERINVARHILKTTKAPSKKKSKDDDEGSSLG